MTIELRGGMTTEDRRLDRLPSLNEQRLVKYPLRPLLAEAPREPRSYSWRHVQLDQGSEGACTGFDETMEAAARPKPFFGDPVYSPPRIVDVETIARGIYYRAKQLDDWPGEDYEGSSVDAAAKAGVEAGYAKGYVWATGSPEDMVNQVFLAIGYHGPVRCGSNWKSSMYRADTSGFLRYSGDVVGGHAFLFSRVSVKKDALWTPNSWGGEGQGWVSREDLVKMASDGAEFCLSVGRRMPA